MKQSRLGSFAESIINVVVGSGLAIAMQATVLPWLLGAPMPLRANLAFAGAMTAVSIARQYSLRRIFDALGVRRSLSPFMQAVIAECFRQRDVEGWSAAHDDEEHAKGDLAKAGVAYVLGAVIRSRFEIQLHRDLRPVVMQIWPWSRDWWKPTVFRRDLVKGVALIIAEGDKFDRARHAGNCAGDWDHPRPRIQGGYQPRSGLKGEPPHEGTSGVMAATKFDRVASSALAHGKIPKLVMTGKRKRAPAFSPGAFYERDDGVRMVEVRPGQFVNERAALGMGIKPKRKGHGKGKAK